MPNNLSKCYNLEASEPKKNNGHKLCRLKQCYKYTFKIIKLLRLKFHNTTTVTSFDKHLVNEHKTNMKRANSNSDFGLCCQ